MEWDNLAVLPVTTFDHWWEHQITNKVRNAARQAEKKGLEVREVPFDEVLLRGIVEIHNESPDRQGRRFPHCGMDLEGARGHASGPELLHRRSGRGTPGGLPEGDGGRDGQPRACHQHPGATEREGQSADERHDRPGGARRVACRI